MADPSQDRLRRLEDELRELREETEARDEKLEEAVQQLEEAYRRIAELRAEAEGLREQLERALETARGEEDLLRELEAERARRGELDDQLGSWRARAEEAERLVEERAAAGRELESLRSDAEALERSLAERSSELERARREWEAERKEARIRRERERAEDLHEVERLQAEVQEARSSADREAKAAEAQVRELEAVRAEVDLQRGEIRDLREELAAKDADLARLAPLAGALDAIRTDRDRLASQQQADAGRAGLLLALLAGMGKLEAGRLPELEQARSRWEAERAELLAERDREMQGLRDEAERRLGEEREMARVEVEGWERRLEAASQGHQHDVAGLRDVIDRQSRDLDDERRQHRAALERAEAAGRERDQLAARLRRLEAARPDPDPPQRAEPAAHIPSETAPVAFRRASRVRTVDSDEYDALDPLAPRGRMPFGLKALGFALVLALCATPYLLLPLSREAYTLSLALGLAGAVIFSYIEGRFVAVSPARHALRAALTGGLIIALGYAASKYLL